MADKKTRNENATCGNCPYWHKQPREKGDNGWCLKTCSLAASNDGIIKRKGWCGEHPDFWKESNDG